MSQHNPLPTETPLIGAEARNRPARRDLRTLRSC